MTVKTWYSSDYVSGPTHDEMCLDGYFTAADLRLIADEMDAGTVFEYQHSGDDTPRVGPAPVSEVQSDG